ncbi:hypothetical protein [Polaromonas sp.]|uniref:hypothetical protein n=1 Tax=Polaromonas sp. TaxID=1869339 RepID=UPI003263960B
MANLENFKSAYAFIESVSKPFQQVSQYERANVVLDIISEAAFNGGRGDSRDPKDLAIVRVMSTVNRLQTRFGLGDITDGKWFRVVFQDKSGAPPAWILGAEDDYGGSVQRTNLIEMQALDDPKSRSRPQVILLADLSALCASAQINSQQQTLRAVRRLPHNDYFVRLVDVGHASFSAIHTSQDANSQILGYFDVGGPVFFHHHTFPKAFSEKDRVPKQGFVALSHWDFDHYSLAVTKLPELRKLRWYAPNQTIGPNAARLQSLLAGNLTLLTQPAFRIHPGLDLWQGTGPTTDRNNSGYVLTVSRQRSKILLTGDANYDMIPLGAQANLSALSITHHGGAGSGFPPTPKGGKGAAGVSLGLPNRYHHPNAASLKAHAVAGWKILRTSHPGGKRGDLWLV